MSKQTQFALPSCAKCWCGPRVGEASVLGCDPRSSRGNRTSRPRQPLQSERLKSPRLLQRPQPLRQRRRQQQHLGHLCQVLQGHLALRALLRGRMKPRQVHRQLRKSHLLGNSPAQPRSCRKPPRVVGAQVQSPRGRVKIQSLQGRVAVLMMRLARAHTQHPQVQGPRLSFLLCPTMMTTTTG